MHLTSSVIVNTDREGGVWAKREWDFSRRLGLGCTWSPPSVGRWRIPLASLASPPPGTTDTNTWTTMHRHTEILSTKSRLRKLVHCFSRKCTPCRAISLYEKANGPVRYQRGCISHVPLKSRHGRVRVWHSRPPRPSGGRLISKNSLSPGQVACAFIIVTNDLLLERVHSSYLSGSASKLLAGCNTLPGVFEDFHITHKIQR